VPYSLVLRLVTFEADVQRALDYLNDFGMFGFHFGAVNISLYFMSSGYTNNVLTTSCDLTSALEPFISALRAAKIPTVIPVGNVLSGWPPAFPATTGPGLSSSFYNGVLDPACITSAITVGASIDTSWAAAVNQFNGTTYFSTMSHSTLMDLWAPGSSIAVGGFTNLRGTSYAAPHVAAIWTRLRGKYPSKSVADVLSLLGQCGTLPDSRNSAVVKPKACIKSAWN
jgi:subtilisin family serine protease